MKSIVALILLATACGQAPEASQTAQARRVQNPPVTCSLSANPSLGVALSDEANLPGGATTRVVFLVGQNVSDNYYAVRDASGGFKLLTIDHRGDGQLKDSGKVMTIATTLHLNVIIREASGATRTYSKCRPS